MIFVKELEKQDSFALRTVDYIGDYGVSNLVQIVHYCPKLEPKNTGSFITKASIILDKRDEWVCPKCYKRAPQQLIDVGLFMNVE